MGIPRPVLPLLATALGAALVLVPTHAVADTRTIHDTTAFDNTTHVIDVKKLKVTYDGNGARAKLYFKDLKRQKRMRLFVAFTTEPDDSGTAPIYGNFLELRIDEKLHQKARNWVIHPSYGDYVSQKCSGIKVHANYEKDVVRYKLPNRCIRFDPARGHVDSYASTRKYRSADWDKGSPANSTGTWFDTTPGVRTPR